jgi:hypothetical protein
MWSLWTSRNDQKHGKSPIPLKQAIDWAMDVFLHLIQANVKVSWGHSSKSQQQWMKPAPGYLKINTDERS